MDPQKNPNPTAPNNDKNSKLAPASKPDASEVTEAGLANEPSLSSDTPDRSTGLGTNDNDASAEAQSTDDPLLQPDSDAGNKGDVSSDSGSALPADATAPTDVAFAKDDTQSVNTGGENSSASAASDNEGDKTAATSSATDNLPQTGTAGSSNQAASDSLVNPTAPVPAHGAKKTVAILLVVAVILIAIIIFLFLA